MHSLDGQDIINTLTVAYHHHRLFQTQSP